MRSVKMSWTHSGGLCWVMNCKLYNDASHEYFDNSKGMSSLSKKYMYLLMLAIINNLNVSSKLPNNYFKNCYTVYQIA